MKFPLAALNQHMAILGKTGSGKTFTAKGIVEGMLADKRQVCVLDPTGAWWGLRLGANGKSPGFDVVLIGGKNADVPLAERSGQAIARLITQQGASVIVDTSGFTVGEYTRWFTDFATTLYTTIRNPLHLVIDEAHYFAPQGKAPDPAAGKMIHACNRLMSGGRSLGIKGMLITQRPAKLHKDSLTCADTLIAMRVIAPQDRQAIKDWIDGAGDASQGKAVLESLAGLQRGEGWVWYPEGGFLERMKFLAIKTYDSSATPVHGAKGGPKVSEIKLDEVKAALAEAVKEAEANDPALLRKKIAELERELKAKPAAEVDSAAVEKAVSHAVAAERAALKPVIAELKKARDLNADVQSILAKAIGDLIGDPVDRPGFPPLVLPSRVPITKQVNRSSAAPPKAVNQTGKPNVGDVSLGKCERAILQVLSQYPEGCDAGKLTLLSGYRFSGGFRNSLSALRSAGLIDGGNGGTMTITAEGEAMGPFELLPAGAKLITYWQEHKSLGKCEKAIFEALLNNPDGLGADDICATTGYEFSGGFRNALSALRTAGLIEGRNTETMKLSGHLLQAAGY